METCKWCGLTYEEHEVERGYLAPKPRVPCLILKSYFEPSAKEEYKMPEPKKTSTWKKDKKEVKQILYELLWFIDASHLFDDRPHLLRNLADRINKL